MLDAGDGVCASLLGKTRKVHRVAVSHADRDHVTGLFQLQQLNAHAQPLEVLYPADSGTFPAMADFCSRFDPQSGPNVTWTGVRPGEAIKLSDDLSLRAIRNSHLPTHLAKSLSYIVSATKRKLKPEHAGKSSDELADLRRRLGEDALTDAVTEPLLGYSGDTGVCDPDLWRGCPIVIHEATFLSASDMESGKQRVQQHSILTDVLEMTGEAKPEILVLNHFSTRYSEAEIRNEVERQARLRRLSSTIYIVPPGRMVANLLSEPPVWAV